MHHSYPQNPISLYNYRQQLETVQSFSKYIHHLHFHQPSENKTEKIENLELTTNLPFEQWTEVLGSQRLTGAVLDRLTHQPPGRCYGTVTTP